MPGRFTPRSRVHQRPACEFSHAGGSRASNAGARARASWPTRPPDPSRTMRDDEPVSTGSAALLEPRLVGDIEGTFFVPDYQRGYRWGEDEVRRLLDDIQEAGGRDYYLQPVVVKRSETADGNWSTASSASPRSTSSSGTSSDAPADGRAPLHDDLRNPAGQRGVPRSTRTEAASLENIDYFHMYQAFTSSRPGSSEQENDDPRGDRALHGAVRDAST